MAYLAATIWMFGSAILALQPDATKAIGQRGTSAAGIASVTGVLREMVDGVLGAVTVPGLVLAALIITVVVIRGRDIRRRDPVRRFSRQQRREGMGRAGGQCEMEAGFRRRCSRPAEHGDHFYPWSKGGSTSLQNFVAACSRCNRAKGAQIPSPSQQERLQRRRRTYVTPEDAVIVGERQPLP
jgi:hypothetical protein